MRKAQIFCGPNVYPQTFLSFPKKVYSSKSAKQKLDKRRYNFLQKNILIGNTA